MDIARYLLGGRSTGPAAFLLLVALPAAAQSVRGTAFDPQGGIVTEARVMLMLDYVKQKETKTDELGAFEFTGVAPGRYELQIKKGRMSLFQRTIFVEAGKDVVVYPVLPPARVNEEIVVSAQRPVAAPRAEVRASAPVRAGGMVEPPQLLRPLRPRYPAGAVERGIEGAVALYARITVEGTVADPVVLRSPDPELEREALRCLQEARYKPMTLNGKAGETFIELLVEFRLHS